VSGRRPSALDETGLVISLSTLSKTLSPGMRVGWVAAAAPVIQALATAKQAADLHTSSIAQRAAARALASFDFDTHVARLCAAYRERRDVMLDSLARYFPAGVR
jgi:DNA-binding transcriptional MocR family regulator